MATKTFLALAAAAALAGCSAGNDGPVAAVPATPVQAHATAGPDGFITATGEPVDAAKGLAADPRPTAPDRPVAASTALRKVAEARGRSAW